MVSPGRAEWKRPAQGRMEAEADWHGLIIAIGHMRSDAQRCSDNFKVDLEAEGKRINCPGGVAIFDTQRHAAVAALDQVETRIASKAMLRHRERLVVEVIVPLIEHSNQREKDWRVTGPECGVAIPQQFVAIPRRQAHELSAEGIDLGQQRVRKNSEPREQGQ